MTPNYVTVACQHCEGGIEFDAAGFEESETREISCPHCGIETLIILQWPRRIAE